MRNARNANEANAARSVAETRETMSRGQSVDPHPRRPASRLLLVNAYLARKRVPALGSDGRYMVLVGVCEGDDFHGGCEEGLFHCSADLGSF